MYVSVLRKNLQLTQWLVPGFIVIVIPILSSWVNCSHDSFFQTSCGLRGVKWKPEHVYYTVTELFGIYCTHGHTSLHDSVMQNVHACAIINIMNLSTTYFSSRAMYHRFD